MYIFTVYVLIYHGHLVKNRLLLRKRNIFPITKLNNAEFGSYLDVIS